MMLVNPVFIERPPAFKLIETVVIAHSLLYKLQRHAQAGQGFQHVLQRAARLAGQFHQPRYVGPFAMAYQPAQIKSTREYRINFHTELLP